MPGRSSTIPGCCWCSRRGHGRGACGGSGRSLPFLPAVPLTTLHFPLVQSLDWETFEQYCTWQLFLAHSIPLETIIPILQHLKYKGERSPVLSPAREGHGAGPPWPRAPALRLSFPLQSTPRRYPACCCSCGERSKCTTLCRGSRGHGLVGLPPRHAGGFLEHRQHGGDKGMPPAPAWAARAARRGEKAPLAGAPQLVTPVPEPLGTERGGRV